MVVPGPAPVRSLIVAVACLAAAAPWAEAEPAAREAFSFAVELVKGSDPDMRAVALERLRDGLPGESYTKELAEQVLPTVLADVQVQLISTLAGRRDAAALPGLVSMAASADESVAAAAVRAIAALGGGKLAAKLRCEFHVFVVQLGLRQRCRISISSNDGKHFSQAKTCSLQF